MTPSVNKMMIGQQSGCSICIVSKEALSVSAMAEFDEFVPLPPRLAFDRLEPRLDEDELSERLLFRRVVLLLPETLLSLAENNPPR